MIPRKRLPLFLNFVLVVISESCLQLNQAGADNLFGMKPLFLSLHLDIWMRNGRLSSFVNFYPQFSIFTPEESVIGNSINNTSIVFKQLKLFLIMIIYTNISLSDCRDIKLQNILLEHKFHRTAQIKLIDFGYATRYASIW